jgi:RNA polymerase sigma factor (sigma-70 family)
MKANNAFDEQLDQILTIEAKELFIDPDDLEPGESEADATDASPANGSDGNILAAYLREISHFPLLTRQEELALGRELQNLKEKKYKLTGQWMVLLARAIKKSTRLPAAACPQRFRDSCLKVSEVKKDLLHCERFLKQSRSGSSVYRSLRRKRAALLGALQEIVSRVNLLKIDTACILRAVPQPASGRAAHARSTKDLKTVLCALNTVEEHYQDAKQKLVQSNLRLVVATAKRFMNWGLVFADLIQEGNIGLMRAADKFDYRLGSRFSTYASWWIRQSLFRAIDQKSRTIRIPVYINDRIKRLMKVSNLLAQKNGTEPIANEIAEEMDASQHAVDRILQVTRDAISLESAGGEEDNFLTHMLKDTTTPSPLDAMLCSQTLEETQDVLSILSPREEFVLRLRYGLEDDENQTLEEIGNKLGLSRERVRQIEEKALHKLRCSAQINELQCWLN